MIEHAPTVLVIDDDDDFRDLAVRALERAGYRTLTARDGAEGLRRIERDEPDLVLLDLVMPGMGGIELLKALRKRGVAPPRVIATSGLPAGSAPTRWHLSKPVDLATLLRVVADFCGPASRAREAATKRERASTLGALAPAPRRG